VLQILAEPNLVTTNGKEASFLVGGEFPVPIVQGGANAGAITILFKEFGIRLTFKPEITGHETIRMHVKPEVSTIDLTNAVSLSGFTIPALATRRMETDIELGPGQSFVIAGLVDDRVTETLSKIPGLANIPILGVLFKSRQENRTKTELIVMVTPEVTAPVNAADMRPLPPMPKQTLPNLLVVPPAAAPAPPEPGGEPAPKKQGEK
jgi:pilus assembly protein CpaC